MPRKPTEGEETFDKYLAENGLKWSLWPDSNDKNPDRIVHTASGDVVCEIKDFGENDEYREIIANYEAVKKAVNEGRDLSDAENIKSSAGRSDLSKATAKRIRKALDQLAVVKDERPTMVVLYNPGYLRHELDLFVREALYGQPQITINIDPSSPSEDHFQYGSGTTGEIRNRNKGLFLKPELAHVSAVAVLENIKLNQQVYKNSQDAFLSVWEKDNPEDRQDSLKLWTAIEEHGQAFIEQHGLDFLEATATRLKIYYNPNCSKRLEKNSFNGSYDEHFYGS